jgi:hypothetical protein
MNNELEERVRFFSNPEPTHQQNLHVRDIGAGNAHLFFYPGISATARTPASNMAVADFLSIIGSDHHLKSVENNTGQSVQRDGFPGEKRFTSSTPFSPSLRDLCWKKAFE